MSARSSRQFFWTFFWMPLLCRVPRPCNGRSTPPSLVVTLAPDHSTLQWHPTMAPSSGTTSTAPCNGTLVPRPIRQSGSSPSPLIGSKNPYSYRYLGNNAFHGINKLRILTISFTKTLWWLSMSDFTSFFFIFFHTFLFPYGTTYILPFSLTFLVTHYISSMNLYHLSLWRFLFPPAWICSSPLG